MAQERPSPLDKYRNLKYLPTEANFDKGWRERVLIEFAIVNDAKIEALRKGLGDDDFHIRAISARALGIREDMAAARALSKLARKDPEPKVRMRAVEALGLLRTNLETVERAKSDENFGVQFSAKLAADQIKSGDPCAEQLRNDYQRGIGSEEIDLAKVGEPAPTFSALTSDGKRFRLSDVVGKKPIAIYFTAFDG